MLDGYSIPRGDMFLVRALFNQEPQVYRCDPCEYYGEGSDVSRWKETRKEESVWPIKVNGVLLGFAALADTLGHAADLLADIRAKHNGVLQIPFESKAH